ncbi:hypothetical protein DV702_01385 [Sporosarcina sp. PTS2304]|uniref:hypothetical protein n=1 Tax=Sporosarcina sp. PTS2304 TaxID=2283194 RepID=UPI000E0DC7B2|nr:hypothetical protein [Sporosarcina sp. PTS2304]AXH98478.1 hypothetical protein DV702_01385 [Sporosarcina sp. PTS2304]
MIRPAMTVWHERSLQLIALTNEVEEAKREEVIEQIEKILDERDLLQSQISQPFTAAEQEAGKELIELEKQVQLNLARFMKTIRANITQSQSKKENINNYTNPYGNMMQDGAYYDTKH